jgi:N-glycosylase/DNA lyase
MKKEDLLAFKKNQRNIKLKLIEFKNLSNEKQFNEFLFCLLTPQSNAQKCWQAVEQLSSYKNPSLQQITTILSTKTRFHNTKAKRLINASTSYNKIKPLFQNPNKLELRNQIASIVNGYGFKESAHFLRNIGHSNNQIAILDRHILRNLHNNNIIATAKIKSPKHYLEIEQSFLNFANSLKIPPDQLDLHWWSQENGVLFK